MKFESAGTMEYVYFLQIYGVLPSNHNGSRKLGGSIPIVSSATPLILCDSFIFRRRKYFSLKSSMYVFLMHTCAVAELPIMELYI